MADDAARRRALQFAHDLREIRKANGISVEDVHHESKIPLGLIESFEETGLLDHVIFNRVYLRSFVRTYADVVGIAPDVALESLEAALDGTYDRRLAVEYLGYEHLEIPDIVQSDLAEAARSDDDLDVRPEPSTVPPGAPRPAPRRVERRQARRSVPPPPPVEATLGTKSDPDAVDWTSQSPPPSAYAGRSRPRKDGAGQWMIPIVGIGVLALVVWGIINLTPSSSEQQPVPLGEAVETGPVDTALEMASPQAPPPVVLGDTMRVTITAANDKVEDVKVKVDDDLRRPYWLELGESRTFTPTRQIIIEQQLENVSLTLEGRSYPTNRIDEQGRIVINRDSARQFLGAGQ